MVYIMNIDNFTTRFIIPIAPWLFVLLWASGFVGSFGVLPFVNAFTILSVRMLMVIGILAVFIYAVYGKSGFAISKSQFIISAKVGILMHGIYLGMVFSAIKLGMHPALPALITSLHPIITSLGGVIYLQETLNKKMILGMFLGLTGSIFAVITMNDFDNISWNQSAYIAIGCNIIGMLGSSFGTIYQKSAQKLQTPFLAGIFVQYLCAFVFCAIIALVFEDNTIIWHPRLIYSLLWLVFGLSIAAVFLLMLLIRDNAVSRASAVFYLVPLTSALEIWLIFDKPVSYLALLGFSAAALGVALIRAKQA